MEDLYATCGRIRVKVFVVYMLEVKDTLLLTDVLA